eukprot:s1826_g9.t1
MELAQTQKDAQQETQDETQKEEQQESDAESEKSVVCGSTEFDSEGYRSFSGTLRTGEANRKKQLPGLDPRTAHWLATLLRRSSMAKEKTITSNKEVWSCRLLVSRVPLAGSRSRSDLE